MVDYLRGTRVVETSGGILGFIKFFAASKAEVGAEKPEIEAFLGCGPEALCILTEKIIVGGNIPGRERDD